jgi:hypothetical protein
MGGETVRSEGEEHVMTEDAGVSYRHFPDYLQLAYSQVLAWLNNEPEAHGFQDLQHERISELLADPTLLSCASQFYDLFPAHYFKVVHTLEEVLNADVLSMWLGHAQQICVLDIGCGAGAASAGFIDGILRLKQPGTSDVNIMLLAVDVNHYALGIYNRLVSGIGQHAAGHGVHVDYQLFRDGIPAAVTPMIECLVQKRLERGQPSLAHVLAMQVNVVSPLGGDHRVRCEQANHLVKMGVSENRIAALTAQFGRTEALAYVQVLQAVPIDYLHVVTISTRTRGYLLEGRVKEMAGTIEQTFVESGHLIERHWQGGCEVGFENPSGSYWRAKARRRHSTGFYVDVTTAANRSIERDWDWGRVVSIDNLRLAWARTRKHSTDDSLFDEIEIRLFEMDLESNLTRLQRQLQAYAEDVAQVDDRVTYTFPKTAVSVRPRALSPLEEEILSVAVIQKLGQKANGLRGMSYAYRLATGPETEYLYGHWFRAYFGQFIEDAREGVRGTPGCAVLMTDVESFFERIVQDELVRLVSGELTESERVRWLLRVLLCRDLDKHDAGLGIVQGNIGSGYYANLYLTAIDAAFGANNPWSLKFFRYSDDMIFVIPNPEDLQDVLDKLDDELRELCLSRNKRKTEVYLDASDFLRRTEPDQVLSVLEERNREVTRPLWIGSDDYRGQFRRRFDNDDAWWFQIDGYRECLVNIGVHVSAADLSRNVHRYLFDDKLCEKDLGDRGELLLPDFPATRSVQGFLRWSHEFEGRNPEWVESAHSLRADLTSLFRDAWHTLKESDGSNPARDRSMRTRVRFALRRLELLGLSAVGPELLEILMHDPSVVGEPRHVLDTMVLQGFSDEILQLLRHYAHSQRSMAAYMSAVTTRSLRFLHMVDMEHWDALADRALAGTPVERLMATETWVHLAHRFPAAPTERHMSGFRAALCGDPSSQGGVTGRVLRNYALIVGQKDLEFVRQTHALSQTSLRIICDMIEADGLGPLFRHEEPGTIRRSYYSGRRLAGAGIEEQYG